jgi:hypothetical protein
MKNVPKINIQKKQEWAIHEENLIREFPINQYSNFKLKWIEIVQRIDNLNLLINDLFIDFHLMNTKLRDDVIEDAILKTPLLYRQKFITEQIFYWVRKTIDEIISIIYVLEFINENNSYPKNLKIDCIGKLINSSNFIAEIKHKHEKILVIINDISNTYKHSFFNSEIHAHIGELDPLVFCYGFKKNDLSKERIFTQYKVEDIINSLNLLLEDFLAHIKQI